MTEPHYVEFRSATTSDVEVLVSLLQGGTMTPEAEGGEDLEGYRAALNELASTGAGDVIVAVEGGEVVAMAQLMFLRHFQHRGGLCAEVESLHVREDLRGQGIGAQLMGELLRRAEERGAYRVQLTSNGKRLDAHRFYGRLGFEASHVGFKFTW